MDSQAYEWIKSKYGEADAEQYKQFCDEEYAKKQEENKEELRKLMAQREPDLLCYSCIHEVKFLRYELRGETSEKEEMIIDVLRSHGIYVDSEKSEQTPKTIDEYTKDPYGLLNRIYKIITDEGMNYDDEDFEVIGYEGFEDSELWPKEDVFEYFKNCYYR